MFPHPVANSHILSKNKAKRPFFSSSKNKESKAKSLEPHEQQKQNKTVSVRGTTISLKNAFCRYLFKGERDFLTHGVRFLEWNRGHLWHSIYIYLIRYLKLTNPSNYGPNAHNSNNKYIDKENIPQPWTTSMKGLGGVSSPPISSRIRFLHIAPKLSLWKAKNSKGSTSCCITKMAKLYQDWFSRSRESNPTTLSCICMGMEAVNWSALASLLSFVRIILLW